LKSAVINQNKIKNSCNFKKMENKTNAPYEFSAQPRIINRPNALSLKVQQ